MNAAHFVSRFAETYGKLSSAQHADVNRTARGPALIVSVDKFNKGPADLVIAIPVTRTNRRILSHVAIAAGEAGLDSESYVMVEAIRSISQERLIRFRGSVDAATMQNVERILRVLMQL